MCRILPLLATVEVANRHVELGDEGRDCRQSQKSLNLHVFTPFP
jgi:hypothetical protein